LYLHHHLRNIAHRLLLALVCVVGEQPGQGEVLLTGGVSDVTRECVRNIRDFLRTDVHEIARVLGLGDEGAARLASSLDRRGADLHVHMESRWAKVGLQAGREGGRVGVRDRCASQ
jgi:hypothetical protein